MKQANTKAIAECKRMRRERSCMRECSFWHTHSREKHPCYCKSALRLEKERS